MSNFVELYRTHFAFVWKCVRCLGVDEMEVDDIVQDIFIIVHSRIGTLQKPESLRSWIYGITRRIACSHRRSKRFALIVADTPQLELEGMQPEDTSPYQGASHSENAELLEHLLEGLDASRREIIEMAELYEMTAPEIAEAINIPINTVYSRLRAARLDLEQALRRYDAGAVRKVPARAS